MLDLLKLAGEEIVVPTAVANEILRRGLTDLTASAIEMTPWLVPVEIPSVPTLIQAWDLGEGESAVLAWGYHHGAEVIIDDLAGRRCAIALGIPVRGTLGLVLAAKKRGKIIAARPILEQLRQSGMYLSGRILNQALALVDE